MALCSIFVWDLECAICHLWWGGDVSQAEQVLLSLPARWGGLEVFNPTETALRTRNGKVSTWLTVLLLARSQFDLSAQEFWDAKAIRYKKPLRNVQDLCDRCSFQFSLSHALSCRKSSLVIQRHNEILDAIDLAYLVWSQVKCEPVMREADTKIGTPALIADLTIQQLMVCGCLRLKCCLMSRS